MIFEEDTITKELTELGATEIKFYMLINNDGYTFNYNGTKYDLRHYRNVYGVTTDFWYISSKNMRQNMLPSELIKYQEKLNGK